MGGDFSLVTRGWWSYYSVLNLVKLDLTGLVDTTFYPSQGFNGRVSSLAGHGDSLYVGGAFSSYRGSSSQKLAKLNITTGNLDTSFTQSIGFNDTVSVLNLFGNSLYIGGDFTTYRGTGLINRANYIEAVDLQTGNPSSFLFQ